MSGGMWVAGSAAAAACAFSLSSFVWDRVGAPWIFGEEAGDDTQARIHIGSTPNPFVSFS